MSKVLTFARKALSANLGKPGMIWSTETIGYDVTRWETEPDGRESPTRTRFVKTLKEAQQVSAQFSK
jgi:hypothetical protein